VRAAGPTLPQPACTGMRRWPAGAMRQPSRLPARLLLAAGALHGHMPTACAAAQRPAARESALAAQVRVRRAHRGDDGARRGGDALARRRCQGSLPRPGAHCVRETVAAIYSMAWQVSAARSHAVHCRPVAVWVRHVQTRQARMLATRALAAARASARSWGDAGVAGLGWSPMRDCQRVRSALLTVSQPAAAAARAGGAEK